MARGRDPGDVLGGARVAAASGCAQGGSRDGSRAEALLRRLRRGLPAVRRDPAGGRRIALNELLAPRTDCRARRLTPERAANRDSSPARVLRNVPRAPGSWPVIV